MQNPIFLTCISCSASFTDADRQRKHFNSDWHRTNLKRKVTGQVILTEDEFNSRVAKAVEVNLKKLHCGTCKKIFGNQKAFDTHLLSKKHLSNVEIRERHNEQDFCVSHIKHEESEEEVEEVDSDEWEDDIDNPIENNDCLFCSHHSKTFVKNIKHMSVAHTFFIPDIEYCIDVKGLLLYLGEKINSGFICIWCNEKGRTFYSTESAKQHMIDKGHCKMLFEGEALAEYSPYYDYSSSYPDDENVDQNEEVNVTELESSDHQLVLPSGAVIGHRSLMRYYKQNIDPNRAVVVSKNSKKLHKVLANYRALGWSEADQQAAAKKARDLHYMKRLYSKYKMQLGVKGNKLQSHFRPQVRF